MLRSLLVAAAVVALSGTARADYAIVVGSNAGGPGQTELRYAEDDARKVGALLVDLGGYTRDQVEVITHPTPDQLRERLGKLAERVAADAAAGKQSRVFFYYSGHARAASIDLGAGELPLAELRQRLFAVPATLTVVVLDACQSGAFARTKGARAAADFSYSSREHLDASGVAVLASSAGSELSQESEQLHSSYFTHHLLVGLRGAGDANGDGEVTLDEAYRYAYHQTLLATAETAVGAQHVTFEADLKGHGEVPLSFPRAATSAIELPAPLEGQALVEDKRAKAVVAEIYKAKGTAMRVAVAPGDYEVIVRHGTTLSHCNVSDGGVVDLDHCTTEAIHDGTTKGGGFQRHERLDVGFLVGPERHDAYTNSLSAFGYNEKALQPSQGVQITAWWQYREWLWLGVATSTVDMPSWSHGVVGSSTEQTLEWRTTTLLAMARAERHLFPHVRGLRILEGYAQGGIGPGAGRTQLTDAMNTQHVDWHLGYALSAGFGLHAGTADNGGGLGFDIGYQYDYQPIIGDLIGNTHASGGHRLFAAFTYAFEAP